MTSATNGGAPDGESSAGAPITSGTANMPYQSPVQGLCGQCVDAFENANQALPPLLQQAVADGRVDPEIGLIGDPGPLKTPCVKGSPAKIWLHIVHLEMLWAFTYGTFVSWEHEMRESMIIKKMEPTGCAFSDTVLRRAGNLLRWSKGLRNDHTPWPTDAPTPGFYLPEEKEITEKVNTIFVAAVAVMLHHEFCHAAFGHMVSGRTPDEVLAQEKEADDFAHHQFLNGFSDEKQKRILGWSILVPWLSCLFVISGPYGLFQDEHPDVHHRITHALKRLNYDDEENQDYFEGLCVTVIFAFINDHKLLGGDFLSNLASGDKFERTSDLLEYCLDQLDTLNPHAQRF